MGRLAVDDRDLLVLAKDEVRRIAGEPAAVDEDLETLRAEAPEASFREVDAPGPEELPERVEPSGRRLEVDDPVAHMRVQLRDEREVSGPRELDPDESRHGGVL